MQVELPLYPVGAKFALAAPGTTNYIFSGTASPTGFTPKSHTVTVHVTVVLATSGVLSVGFTNGISTVVAPLNNGTALTAGALNTFTFEARAAQTYDFKLGTDGIVSLLYVSEIQGAGG